MMLMPALVLMAMSHNAAPSVIALAEGATAAETTAARELSTYPGKMTGRAWPVIPETRASSRRDAIWVGPTAQASAAGLRAGSLRAEEWVVRSTPRGLVVTGGRPRGTLYAAWHLLERLGVRWWTPCDETVPRIRNPRLTGLNLRGEPAFRYRDVYMVEDPGADRWCARNRLNRNGDRPIGAELGGAMDYGPPYHVHTFYNYVPPGEFFASHPEYFAEVGGKRTGENAQLCTTNADVRRLMLERLRAYIAQSRAEAAKTGSPASMVYSVSQNDWGGFCECAQCKAAAEREGGYAGPYIDLANYLADGIRNDYPDVAIDTLAYFMTQKPPRSVRPRDNVIIRLCDTGSNFARPITDPANKAFRDHITSWANIAKRLRIWDYAVTYCPHSVLPFASAQTYPLDFRFYRDHNVEGVFTEHEYSMSGDMRDLKLWLMARFLEDPNLDYAAALREFTDGYYGAAGAVIRIYLSELQAAQEKAGSFIGMGSGPISFIHLTPSFVARAHELFDRAERAVAGKPDMLHRVRVARLSLDRATLALARRLNAQLGSASCPWDRDAVARRALETWLTEIDRRVAPAKRESERAAARREIETLAAVRLNLPLPEPFRGLPAGSVQDHAAETFRNFADQARVVQDAEAETGTASRFEIPDAELAKYALPIPWGTYDTVGLRGVVSARIAPEAIPGPGYHWYRLPACKVGTADYVWFFWSWIIQCDLSDGGGDLHEVHARIKFEGPAFPHGKPDQRNAISVERIVAVQKR